MIRATLRALPALALAVSGLAGAPASAEPPPVMPPATYKTVSAETFIRMSDGVHLAATVVFPSLDGAVQAPGTFPVVLAMTPYSRNGVCGCMAPAIFAQRGMIGAVVDVRGTGGSEGNLEGNYFSPRESRDGYELVEYFGTRPYSSGRVGMAGGSYVGITQYLTAAEQPPHLSAITPVVPLGDVYRDAFAHGGIQSAFFDTQYVAVQGGPGAAGFNTDPSRAEQTLTAKAGQSPPGYIAFDYLARPNDDEFYRERSPIYKADRIQVPVLTISQWRDGLLRGAPEMHQALAKRPGVETRLYVGPCTHKGCNAPFAPFTNPPGQRDLNAMVFEFLAKYLLDAPTPARPAVEFYVQGANVHQESAAWPPEAVEYERLNLGQGILSSEAQPASEATYFSNPAAGASLAFNRYGTVAASPYVPLDQRLEEPQGLAFRTSPLFAPLRMTGPLALHLVASSTATDTDWYAKVSDVAPDGTESIITEGALRASHRALDPLKSTPQRPYHTHSNPEPIEPGVFYGFDIEIWPTAYELAPGHRLQVRVTSSDLPTHLPGSISLDRNDPSTARVVLNDPAFNTVRFGPSYLLVPKAL